MLILSSAEAIFCGIGQKNYFEITTSAANTARFCYYQAVIYPPAIINKELHKR